MELVSHSAAQIHPNLVPQTFAMKKVTCYIIQVSKQVYWSIIYTFIRYEMKIIYLFSFFFTISTSQRTLNLMEGIRSKPFFLNLNH